MGKVLFGGAMLVALLSASVARVAEALDDEDRLGCVPCRRCAVRGEKYRGCGHSAEETRHIHSGHYCA